MAQLVRPETRRIQNLCLIPDWISQLQRISSFERYKQLVARSQREEPKVKEYLTSCFIILREESLLASRKPDYLALHSKDKL